MIAYWTVASHLQPAALRARRRAVREERTRHARVGRMGRGDEKKGPLGEPLGNDQKSDHNANGKNVYFNM